VGVYGVNNYGIPHIYPSNTLALVQKWIPIHFLGIELKYNPFRGVFHWGLATDQSQ